MKILALDTTSNLGSVALLENETVLKEISWENPSSHTALLPLQLKKILEQTKVPLDEMDFFAVAKGPGSFTGIRVGLAFVKGLTLLSEKPVLGISTLETLGNISPIGLVGPILDARREQIFGALYRHSAEALEILIQEQAEFPEKFFEKIKNLQKTESHPLVFLGNGAKKYADFIRKEWGESAQIISEIPPLASFIGRLAFNKFKQGLTSASGIDLLPSYLRESAAEMG